MSDGSSQAYSDLHQEEIREKDLEKFLSFFKEGARKAFIEQILENKGLIDEFEFDAMLHRVKSGDLNTEDMRKVIEALNNIDLSIEQNMLLKEYSDNPYFLGKIFLKIKN